MKLDVEERVLHFKQPAGTSRGVYTTRRIWLITATDEAGRVTGVGECAPLPQLSCDDIPNYAEVLRRFCDEVERTGEIPYEALRPYPSMLFGLESIKPTPCPPTPTSIPINGLVWMGTFEEMHQRIEEKLAAGFHCVKLKIGAIDWNREIALIRFIRERYSREQIELRVDANGGFSVDEAMSRLEELAKYDIHSIEQPIRQHQWAEMASLCQHSPLPIALDEELIGVNDPEEKVRLFDTIRPQYIILKPSCEVVRSGYGWHANAASAHGLPLHWRATSASMPSHDLQCKCTGLISRCHKDWAQDSSSRTTSSCLM